MWKIFKPGKRNYLIQSIADDNSVTLEPQTISLKALLTASVEMAKLGGHEVRGVRQQVNDRGFLKKWATRTLFLYFRSFQTQILLKKLYTSAGFRTQIVRVVGEHADHFTTTTTAKKWRYFVELTCFMKEVLSQYRWHKNDWFLFSSFSMYKSTFTYLPMFTSVGE